MAGKGSEIKEYMVGLEVFDKTAGFDPKVDSTVRTEASKLRSRLERFYETDSQQPEIRIRIPKGGYAAVFETSAAPPEAGGQWKRWGIATGVVVLVAAVAIPLWLRSRPHLSQPSRVVPLANLPGMEVYPRFSPDGTKVVFAWVSDPDRRSIYVRDIDGVAPRRLTNVSGYDAFPAWSPDGKTIAFYRTDAVMLAPAAGGPERKLVDASDVSWLAWSPNGAYLAITRRPEADQASRVYLVSSSTGEAHAITSPAAASPGDVACVFSPDGAQVAFVRNNGDGDWAIEVTGVQGGSTRTLLQDRYRILGLDWLARTNEIVFAWERDGVRRLWRIPASARLGVAATRLGGLDSDARNPAVWSARSGTQVRVAFETRSGDTDIFQERLAAGGKPVAFASSSAIERAPQFSFDGAWVAFLSGRSGSVQVWVAKPDGSGLRQLTHFPGSILDVSEPAWNRDGASLVVSAFESGDWRAYIVRTSDGTARRVSQETSQERQASWSADGKWIYFSSDRSGRTEIWKMPAAGGAAVQVTKNGGEQPVESAGGDRVFFVRDAKSRGLWSMPASGGPETLVIPNAAPGWWQVMRDCIYFADYGETPTVLKRVALDGSASVRVKALAELTTTNKPGMTVAPDGGSMLYSKPVYSVADLVLAEYAR